MKIDDPKIVALRELVTAAQQEFDMAVAFHEVWKPATYDKALHSRLGTSFATQAFIVMRTALRREMLLAMIRLWDSNQNAIRMQSVFDALHNQEMIEGLALERVDRLGMAEAIDEMKDDLNKRAKEATELIGKYMKGGKSRAVFEKLLALRHQRLAHRQLERTKAAAKGASATDEEIEEFYQDNSKLIEMLLSVVKAIAYAPQETAYIYGFYADHFWRKVT
jgi:hypothetical protein